MYDIANLRSVELAIRVFSWGFLQNFNSQVSYDRDFVFVFNTRRYTIICCYSPYYDSLFKFSHLHEDLGAPVQAHYVVVVVVVVPRTYIILYGRWSRPRALHVAREPIADGACTYIGGARAWVCQGHVCVAGRQPGGGVSGGVGVVDSNGHECLSDVTAASGTRAPTRRVPVRAVDVKLRPVPPPPTTTTTAAHTTATSSTRHDDGAERSPLLRPGRLHGR